MYEAPFPTAGDRLAADFHLTCATAHSAQANKPVPPRPALLPAPVETTWRKEVFDLRKCRFIVCPDSSFRKEALRLQKSLTHAGSRTIPIINYIPRSQGNILMLKTQVKAPVHANEAYSLDIGKRQITLSANTDHGMFNALQTLQQLTFDHEVQERLSATGPLFPGVPIWWTLAGIISLWIFSSSRSTS